jgi:hypothetical protein
VSLSLAKDQHLSLNPAQISGGCGRLLCCLRYEHDFYVSSRKRFPKEGKAVETRAGTELVQAVDIFRERLLLRSQDGSTRTLTLAEFREETQGGPRTDTATATVAVPSAPPPAPTPAPPRDDRPRRERPPQQQRPRPQPQAEAPKTHPPQADVPAPQGESAQPGGDQPRKKRRRRRRRGRGGPDGHRPPPSGETGGA